MSSPTPGPWRTQLGDSVVHIVDDTGAPIAATTTKAYHERHDARDVANANVLAAAWEMREALREVMAAFRAYQSKPGPAGLQRIAAAEQQADAALAKADTETRTED